MSAPGAIAPGFLAGTTARARGGNVTQAGPGGGPNWIQMALAALKRGKSLADVFGQPSRTAPSGTPAAGLSDIGLTFGGELRPGMVETPLGR